MFGKYAKKYTLQEVARKDPKYLEWVISADFSQGVKALAEDALKGHFPKFKEEEDTPAILEEENDLGDQLYFF